MIRLNDYKINWFQNYSSEMSHWAISNERLSKHNYKLLTRIFKHYYTHLTFSLVSISSLCARKCYLCVLGGVKYEKLLKYIRMEKAVCKFISPPITANGWKQDKTIHIKYPHRTEAINYFRVETAREREREKIKVKMFVEVKWL